MHDIYVIQSYLSSVGMNQNCWSYCGVTSTSINRTLLQIHLHMRPSDCVLTYKFGLFMLSAVNLVESKE
jgi:hypothetical protein